jgi:hypothetical protein
MTLYINKYLMPPFGNETLIPIDGAQMFGKPYELIALA